MKRIWKNKGLWIVLAGLFLIYLLFGKIISDTVAAVPSPERADVRHFYLWIIRLGCGFLVFCGFFLWRKKGMPGWLFPATVFGLGLLYMSILTPFSAPDEARHFASAYRLSNQIMGKQAVADEAFIEQATEKEREYIARGGNVLVREQDAMDAPYAQVNQEAYHDIMAGLLEMDSSQDVTVRYEAPVNTTPVVYLPQALGITAARVFHIGYLPLIYMGRLFNLLAFTGLAYLAVRLMPFKKEMLMAVCLLPMTLHLAASFSYDAMLIGLSMILLAWVFHLTYEKEKIEVRDIVALALLLALLEPCKIVYLPMVGICLFLPMAKFGSKKSYWISVAAVLFILALSVFLINHVVLAAWIGDTENYISWDGGVGYTIQDILKEPYQTFRLYYDTLVTQFDYYQATMLGAFLGNLDPGLSVPYFCLFLLWGVLFVTSVRQEKERVFMTGGQKVWMAFLAALSVVLVLFSMLLGWTPKGSPYIMGIQGRYFLPLLPFALVLLCGENLVIKKDVTKGAYYLECFVNVYALIRICSLAIVR